MTKILATWTKLKTKFTSTVRDKQARMRLLSDKLSEADKELRVLEWEKRWLERWEKDCSLIKFDSEKIKALVLKSGQEFKVDIDFKLLKTTYSPSLKELKELIVLIREYFCREGLKNVFGPNY